MSDEPRADDTGAEHATSEHATSEHATSEHARTDLGTDPGSEPVTQQPVRRPTAAASAASRARRIGGARTSPAPTPAAPSARAGEQSGTAPISVEKKGTSPADGAATASGTPATAPSGIATGKPDRKAAGTGEAPGAAAASTSGSTTSGAAAKDRVVFEVPAWLRWVPAGVLSVCAVVMLVLLLTAAHGVWYSKPSASTVRDQVLAAAKTCTAAANTYSYQTLPQDEKKGLACSTGLWSSQYRKAIKSIVTPAATKLKASQSIQINDAGIESISSNGQQWTVIVYGQTKIMQSGQKTRLDPFSAEVRMQHVGGAWLISKIDTIVNPSS